MKRIILFSGKAQAGKDTFANVIKEILEEQGERVVIIHYADYLKFLCKSYFGWDGEKDDAGRTILQRIGTDVIREIEPDFWVDSVIKFIELFEHEFDFVLIPDTRFPNEIVKMEEKFGYSVISTWITRLDENGERFNNSLSEEQKRHKSETALDWYLDFSYSFVNQHMHEIREKVVSFLKAYNLIK